MVIVELYSEMPNDPNSNELLRAMSASLSKVDDPAARLLNNEIEQWLEGRVSYNSGN